MSNVKVAFICVHNSCRSQIAEAFGRHLASDVFQSYSAGTETKPQINQDAVRIMKELYNIDMEADGQFSKLVSDIPNPDIAISMGCNVGCPFIGRLFDDNWGLEDPTGKSDEEFKTVIEKIRKDILKLKKLIDNTNSDNISQFPISETSRFKLGELQSDYNAFAKALRDEQLFTRLKPYSPESLAANQSIYEYKSRIETTKQQLNLEKAKFDLTKTNFQRSQNLFNQGVISKMELENEKIKYFSYSGKKYKKCTREWKYSK